MTRCRGKNYVRAEFLLPSLHRLTFRQNFHLYLVACISIETTYLLLLLEVETTRLGYSIVPVCCCGFCDYFPADGI